ncbi:MAG: isocitrate/isopropylmalate dehydrogenase family protein [Candidatus Eremiobacteraeota bacterium]|nr:isocitrate/isopropylmalate dehydrogenase family protein [Candidatus Eremiobacteraeota bacterium]
MDSIILEAREKFVKLIEGQLRRSERIKRQKEFIRYDQLEKILIGVVGGDGIGPIITMSAHRALKYLLRKEVQKGRVEFRIIDDLTIENRAQEMKPIPEGVLQKIKECHVILKGPTTTPREGDPWPNIESANIAIRKELDLFANVRPIKVPEKGIDWTFFRENTEGAYTLGSDGFNINDDVAIDFTVTTTEGTERIARMAFEYAARNEKKKVTVVTKANVIKTTDGKFLSICREVAEEYPEIEADDWYIDIMTAKLIDEKRRTQFQVFVLPNLYGDILTDEAAELQGGVGTAGSANIGKRYAMFEAIHGSAPRMVREGRGKYANPTSIMRAAVMLLSHIGYEQEAKKMEKALDICTREEKKLVITGRNTGATCEEFANYVIETIKRIDSG